MIELQRLAEELGESVETLLEWERYAIAGRRIGDRGRASVRATAHEIGDWPAERIRFVARARAAGIGDRGVLEHLAMTWEDRPADTYAIALVTFAFGERPAVWVISSEAELERLVETALVVVAVPAESRARAVVA